MNFIVSKNRSWLLAGFLLGLFLLAQALFLRSYIRIEVRPPAWDQANHLDVALSYRQLWGHGDWSGIWHFVPKSDIPPFPPLYQLGISLLLGTDNPAWQVLWLNWFYLAVLSISMLGIAWEMRKDVSDVCVPVIFVCAPVLQGLLYTQLPDLALTACVSMSYWVLLRSRGFSSYRLSVLWGALFAVGMLHKWSFFSYLMPAYYIAWKAWRSQETRKKVLLAAGTALLFSSPWYLVRIPLVISRLMDASADMAVPVWEKFAFFQYLGMMISGLGPCFWGCALWGVLQPKIWKSAGKERVILAWVLSSYLFWAIVPNRQLRYLLPGLPGLAVVCASVLPKPVMLVLAVVQIFGAANYAKGWVGPMSLPKPLNAVSFFPNSPARGDDWRIIDILRSIEGAAVPSAGRKIVVLLANHQWFNELNFIWTAHQFGFSDIAMSGVNSSLWPLAPFVLIKEGFLGPAVVVPGLEDARGQLNRPDGWFRRNFVEMQRWPLPDGTSAVLFSHRCILEKPQKQGKISIPRWSAASLSFEDAVIRFGTWNPRLSRYNNVSLTIQSLQWRGLALRDVRVELENALVEKDSEGHWNLLALESAHIVSAVLRKEDMARCLGRWGLDVQDLRMDKGLDIQGRYRHIPFSMMIEVLYDKADHRVRMVIKRVGLGFLSVPGSFIHRYILNGPLLDVSMQRDETIVVSALKPGNIKILPFRLHLEELTFAGESLSIH